MSLRAGSPVIHTMTGGVCSVCGENADWLAERCAVMVDLVEE